MFKNWHFCLQKVIYFLYYTKNTIFEYFLQKFSESKVHGVFLEPEKWSGAIFPGKIPPLCHNTKLQ